MAKARLRWMEHLFVAKFPGTPVFGNDNLLCQPDSDPP